jgi:hypothetical protein
MPVLTQSELMASASLPPRANDQRPQCERLLRSFLARFDVRPFRYRQRNLRLLLLQSGASEDQIKAVMRDRWGAYQGRLSWYHAMGNVFDHYEMWGRDRTPLFLVGHPYDLGDESAVTLAAIRGLGLVASDYHPSWYGFGTVQIRVYHPGTVERVTGVRPV